MIHKIIVVLIDAICICLGLWIYTADRRSKIHQTFSWMTVFLFIWITFGYFATIGIKGNDALASIFIRINMGTVCLFFIPFYFFAVHFPVTGKRYPILDKFILVFWTVFCFLSFFTNSIAWIKDSQVVYGDILGSIFLLMSFVVAIMVFVLVFKKYLKIPVQEKTKAQYLLVGLSLFIFGNIFFNIFLPLVLNTTEYYAFGDYSAILLLIFVAIAIVKQKLFGIKVLLSQLLVFSMGFSLLVLVFLVEDISIKVLATVIFLLFCVFGFFLIKSVIREAEQKEILEEKVQERTKKLAESNEELTKKSTELEKWYKLTVGRELRMAELKEKMKKLEE